MLNLSKSKYCMAIQCPKMLWMKKNMPEEFDESALNQSALDNGNMVGDLAMGLLGDYVEVPFSKNLSEMIDKTAELIADGTPIICEASFDYNGAFCSVDILKNNGDKVVELYEVKSSTSLSDIYLEDVAYQCYVLKMNGYKVTRACVVYLNNQYIRHGALDIQQLFHIEDVTTTVFDKIASVPENIKRFEKYMEQTSEPADDISPRCFDPYDCGFWGYCTRKLPKPNVFDVAGLLKRKKFECYYDNIISFEDLNTCGKLNPKQYRQVEYELFDYAPHIEKQCIKDFLDTLTYPLYFLDFESYQPPVPLFDNTKPYQQIAFQYSLHYYETEGGELKHKEYLAYPGGDPRRALAEQLCRDIPLDVCTTAYNKAFEQTRLREMAEIYPDLHDHLMNIHDHIVDLMLPFQHHEYYTKAMQGSYSIKYVLPALFPNDPSLDYHNLESVHNGSEASAMFDMMSNMNPEDLEKYRKDLLKYCGLDTYAMVKVFEKLQEVVK